MEQFILDAGGPPAPPALTAATPTPLPRDRTFAGRLSMAEWLLKHREYLLDEIEAGREIPVILADLLVVCLVPTAFYGLVVGVSTNSLVRILSNPIKLPLMLIVTLCLCLPTLYIFSSYLGSRRSFLQTAALAFTGIAITGVVLAAFAPITWFLTFTAPGAHSLHVLVNVLVFAIGGFMGVQFLLAGARRLHADLPQLKAQLSFLWSWIILYGLVGLQMGYLFSPFFSTSDVWIRVREPGEASVFEVIFRLLGNVLG